LLDATQLDLTKLVGVEVRYTDLDVDSKRHDEDGDHDIGDCQRHDEEVRRRAQAPLPPVGGSL